MPRLIEADYSEQYLLPPSLEDWVGPEHPARLVRELVDQLDLVGLGFVQPEAGTTGRPAYAPALLLRLWLYGYLCRIRSTRKLEAAAREQIGFVWLCGNQAPDHNSLWRFWQANRKPLRAVFQQTVRVAMRLQLVGMVVQAIDGTKLQASSAGGWGQPELERELLRLEEHIDAIEAEVQSQGQAEEALGTSGLRQELAQAGQLRGAVAQALAEVQRGERKHVHPLEPDASRMKVRHGAKPFAYNAQAVVDDQARIIVAADVSPDTNDARLAQPLMEQAEANTDGATAESVSLADTGYSCSEAHRQAAESSRALLTPLQPHVQNASNKAFHASKFQHDALTDTVRCPAGQTLPYARTRLKDGLEVRVYRSRQACAGCPVRSQCTGSKARVERTIELTPGHAATGALRQRLQDPAQRALLDRRGSIVEPVFGWIKGHLHDAFKRFTVRGIDNVRAQWALLCAARNLRTIHQSWCQRGCPPLLPLLPMLPAAYN